MILRSFLKKLLKMSLDESQLFTLTSSDGASFTLSSSMTKISGLLTSLSENDKDANVFHLENVDGKTLSKIIEYIEYHYTHPPIEIEKPLRSTEMKEMVGEWDANWIDVGDDELFDLILAANYLNIPSLLDLGCAKVATFMKGKTVEQIRDRFHIENDLTPAEVEAIKEENKWALH